MGPQGPNESNRNGSKWDQRGPKGPNGSYWALEYKWIQIGQYWATVFKWIHFGPKNQNGRTVRRTVRTVKDQPMTEGYWRQTGSS